jgi:hypothetical protein
MASPLCTVQDGAGAAQGTTNGVNVTPGNTITIALVSAAGVNTWSISCVYTDDLSTAVTVTSSLVINNTLKTATFTAPVAGRAYIFQSQINAGLNPATNAADPTATTTFGVYTLISSKRVIATNETTEGSSTFGWISALNTFIRNPTTAVDATTSAKGIVQLAQDLAGTATAPTVVSASGAGGVFNVTAVTTRNTSDAKLTFETVTSDIQTTNATPTTLMTFSLGSTTGICVIRGVVTACDSTGASTGAWSVDAAYKDVAGTLTALGTPTATAYGTPTGTLALALSISTNTVLLTATGIAATTIRWTCNGFKDFGLAT